MDALDSVANFNQQDSLSAAIQPLLSGKTSKSLVLTAITDLHLETKTAHLSISQVPDSSSSKELDGAVVLLSIGNGNNSGNGKINGVLETSSITSPHKGMILVCFLSAGNRTLVDNRTSTNTSSASDASHTQAQPQAPNRVLLSLGVFSDPITALGLHPLNGRADFYLPIGWIDVSDKGGRGDRGDRGEPFRARPAYASPTATRTHVQPQYGNGGNLGNGLNGANGGSERYIRSIQGRNDSSGMQGPGPRQYEGRGPIPPTGSHNSTSSSTSSSTYNSYNNAVAGVRLGHGRETQGHGQRTQGQGLGQGVSTTRVEFKGPLGSAGPSKGPTGWTGKNYIILVLVYVKRV